MILLDSIISNCM